MATILEALSNATGAKVVMPADSMGDETPVTAHFDDVPLEQALQRLLGSQSYLLVHTGRTFRLELLLRPKRTYLEAENQPESDPIAMPGADPSQAVPRMLLIRTSRPIPLQPRLAAALGSHSATFQQLLDAARGHPERRVQRDALKAATRAIDQSSDIREALFGHLADLDDGTLARMIHAQTGDEGQTFVADLVRHLRRRASRTRALAVMRELRKPGAPPTAPSS